MKNIHVLPTDKPSRLYLFEERLILGDLVTVVFKNSGAVNQNIYITSDEEIKEVDWILNETHNIEKAISHYNYKSLSSDCKKIILTTDQDLIKDGVQAINDEFLEWFVKNPSCEEVEVVKTAPIRPFGSLYKIIIPKEEPKQETLEETCDRLFPIAALERSITKIPNPADFMKLGEDAFIKNVHEKLRETLSPTEKQMCINGYLLALTQQNKR